MASLYDTRVKASLKKKAEHIQSLGEINRLLNDANLVGSMRSQMDQCMLDVEQY